MIRAGLLTLAAIAGLSFGAQAQTPSRPDNCILDRCGDRETKPTAAPAQQTSPARPVGPSIAPGRFDFYVLALSWSPSFCLSTDRRTPQCDRGANNGFVLHGLWPQFERGFPADCDSRQPSAVAMQAARGVWPDEGLARYEWRKHGTCSGKAPQDYFLDAKFARDSVKIPEELKAPKTQLSMSPNEIQRAFMDANARLRPGMMAVQCQRGVLQEVRICMTKDLRDFRTCPEVVRSGCRTQNMSVPPVR